MVLARSLSVGELMAMPLSSASGYTGATANAIAYVRPLHMHPINTINPCAPDWRLFTMQTSHVFTSAHTVYAPTHTLFLSFAPPFIFSHPSPVCPLNLTLPSLPVPPQRRRRHPHLQARVSEGRV